MREGSTSKPLPHPSCKHHIPLFLTAAPCIHAGAILRNKTRASDPRWWTPECSSAIAQTHSAWKRWSHSKASETLKAAYVQAVTNAVSTLQQAQLSWEEHLKQKLRTGNLRDKQWWSTIKAAAGKERHSDIPTLVDSNQREHLTARSKAECFGTSLLAEVQSWW